MKFYEKIAITPGIFRSDAPKTIHKICGVPFWWPFPLIRFGVNPVALGCVISADYRPPGVVATYQMFRKLHSLKYWFAHRYVDKHRYHIINTGLKPGYHSPDARMFFGSMALLEEYIDGQGGHEKYDLDTQALLSPSFASSGPSTTIQYNTQVEILLIYRWWKFERPADEAKRDQLQRDLYSDDRNRPIFGPVSSQTGYGTMTTPPMSIRDQEVQEQLTAIDDKISFDEDEYLIRLAKVRRSMWD